MKKIVVLLVCLSLCFLISCKNKSGDDKEGLSSGTSSLENSSGFSSQSNNNSSSYDLSSIVFAEASYTVEWSTIKYLPENFPKLSEYVTFSSYSKTVIDICWNILSEEKQLEFVNAIEQWTGSKMALTNDGYNVYNSNYEDDNNTYKINFIYQPSLDGQYDETISDWSAQARLYIYTESKN